MQPCGVYAATSSYGPQTLLMSRSLEWHVTVVSVWLQFPRCLQTASTSFLLYRAGPMSAFSLPAEPASSYLSGCCRLTRPVLPSYLGSPVTSPYKTKTTRAISLNQVHFVYILAGLRAKNWRAERHRALRHSLSHQVPKPRR